MPALSPAAANGADPARSAHVERLALVMLDVFRHAGLPVTFWIERATVTPGASISPTVSSLSALAVRAVTRRLPAGATA